MFATRLICRRSLFLQQNFASSKCKNYSEQKYINNCIFLGGGLEKLQGSIKEEEYFSTINYDLMTKIRKQVDTTIENNSLDNWDEYQKSLDHSAFQDSCCMNKHKNCQEEAFFMAETADCVKLIKEREKSGDSLEALENNEIVDANIYINEINIEAN